MVASDSSAGACGCTQGSADTAIPPVVGRSVADALRRVRTRRGGGEPVDYVQMEVGCRLCIGRFIKLLKKKWKLNGGCCTGGQRKGDHVQKGSICSPVLPAHASSRGFEPCGHLVMTEGAEKESSQKDMLTL